LNGIRLESGGLCVKFTNLDGQQVEVVTCMEPEAEQVISTEPVYGWFSWERSNGNGHGVLRAGNGHHRSRVAGAGGGADGIVERADDVGEGQ